MTRGGVQTNTLAESHNWRAVEGGTGGSFVGSDDMFAVGAGTRATLLSTVVTATLIGGWATGAHPSAPTLYETDYRAGALSMEEVEYGARNAVAADGSATAIAQLQRRLESFKSYPINWDGHQGIAATPEAVAAAQEFLEALPYYAPLPRIGLSGDGEVGMFWDFGEDFIDLGFDKEGNYSFYAHTADGAEIMGDATPVSADLPQELLRVLESYS